MTRVLKVFEGILRRLLHSSSANGFQFTGTDKANLLSTALTKTLETTLRSQRPRTPLPPAETAPTKSFSEKTFRALQHLRTGADSVSVTASATSSDIQGNRGADTIRVTGELTSTSVKGGQDNDTIHISGGLASASVFGGSGNDSITFDNDAKDISKTLIQDGQGSNVYNITAQSFEDSTAKGGSGADLIDFASSFTSSEVQGASGNDTVRVTGDASGAAFKGGEARHHSSDWYLHLMYELVMTA